jgi:hypothetical protein
MARYRFQAPLKKQPQTPRNVVTGTSLEATGHLQPDTSPEQGSSYVAPTTNPPVEQVPELSSPYQRSVAYARMMNDSSVDVSVRAWKTPVLGAEFFVDPYSDDPLDSEIAEFIWSNLAGGLEQPLLESLQDILHMCEDGYSVVEKVYENREWTPPTNAASPDGTPAKTGGSFRNTKVFTMLKSLAFRPTTTINDIEYDNNGKLTQVTQGAIQADHSVKDVTIKEDKLLVFTLNKKGGDITGKSILRTAYPHWYYKTHFYKIDAIQKERHGIGVPRGKLLAGYSENDKIALRNMLRNLRTNEEAFIMQTPNVEIDFAELKGQLVNVIESAEHHSGMILLNVMASFLGLGVNTHGGSGSRAVGSTQSDMFMKSLKFIAEYICQVINMEVVPELVVYNYKTTNFPQLKVRGVGETRDLQMLASGLANLIAQGGITMDLPTEQWMRRTFDMPAKQQGVTEYAPPTKEVIQVTGQQPKTAGGNGQSPTTGVTSQKGNVQPQNPTTGQGNVGKPPSAQ